jgi:cyclase
MDDFLNLFEQTQVEGALAASVFHSRSITIPSLKQFLFDHQIEIRL